MPRQRPTTMMKYPKGEVCVSVDPKRSKEAFHKNSFRFVPVPGPGNEKATILVGCPLEFNWEPKAVKQGKDDTIIRGVCTNPFNQAGGTRRYLKIQQPINGQCRPKYKLVNFDLGEYRWRRRAS